MSEFPKCFTEDSLYEFELQEKKRLTEDSKKIYLKSRAKSQNKRQPKLKHDNLEHLHQWQDHRQRVKQMVASVDSKPPYFQAARQTGVNGLYQNAVSFMGRTKNNMQMLAELTKIKRTHGVINSFRYDNIYTTSSVPLRTKNLERIEKENHDIAKRLLNVISEIDTGLKSYPNKCQPESRRQKLKPLIMNVKHLAKYKGYNIEMPKTNKDRWRLFRPNIYFDIYLKDSRPLGRIVMELFTEAAPVVVLELVRACMSNMHNDFVIRRVFPNLWLNVELPLASNSELRKPLEYDANIINQGAFSNVLSFSKDYLQGFRNNLTFSMSFKPLNVANGSRVGFGRVIKNSKMFECLQSYGTKNGKLSRNIIFTGCGIA